MRCAEFSAKFIAAGGTQRVFQLARNFSGKDTALPTCHQVSDMGSRLFKMAEHDLDYHATADGVAISVRAAAELAIHQFETTPPPKPRRMTSSGRLKSTADPIATHPELRRPKAESEPARFVRRAVFKLSLDARQVTKTISLRVSSL